MAPLKRLAFLFLMVLCGAATADAALVRDEAFEQWLQGLQMEAVADGVSAPTAQNVLSDVELDDRVLALDGKQPETTITFEDYVRRTITADRVAEGRRLLRENAATLEEVGKRYSVQPKIIVALWGVESSFGRNSGDFSVIDALVTLAYGGRRAEFFRKELLNALHIIDQQHMKAAELRGSWAGAMGQCQFMPSTYLHFAASFTNSSPNIWDNQADVFASIANYIAAEGWRGDRDWGYEVTLVRDIPETDVGLTKKQPVIDWEQEGVRGINGESLPDSPVEMSLIAPDGAGGRHFLVSDNFRALMRWNHSTFFATSIGLLADRIE
ncbi:MAG: lytic murein transglycosylase [Pseudomonadota bacterium]|nr:lytic murein transglycosylase [Pseudomonadota bacterium]